MSTEHFVKATTTAEKLERIHGLLEQASAVFYSLPTPVQDRINDIHHEDTNMAYCLRWGIKAAEEAQERVQEQGDDLDFSPRP